MARIAVIDLVFNWPPIGGSMVDIREVSYRLHRMGHEIMMFVPDFQSLYPRGLITRDPGFPVTKIPFNRFTFNYKLVPKRFKKAVEAFRPDYVFLADGYFLKAFIALELHRYPLIWRAYAYETFCPKNNLVDTFTKQICRNTLLQDNNYCFYCFKEQLGYKKTWLKLLSGFSFPATGIFLFQEYWFGRANSPLFADTLKKAIRTCRKIIVYNEVQAELFRPYAREIVLVPTGIDENFMACHIEKPNSKPVILMSGRIDDIVKGYDFLFEACRQLHEKGYDFELWITTDKKPKKMAPFVRLIGWNPPDKLPEIISSADIVCVPSLWQEAFGIVAIEGMACSKPVVATKVGGLQHIVQHGHTGFLVEPNDTVQLSRRLQFLIENPEARIKMGKAGLERVNTTYRWNIVMESVYAGIFS